MNYTLENALKMHNIYPQSFDIPTFSEINSLKVGDFAKLIFKQDERGERMWVQIISILDGQYTGRLDNNPVLVSLNVNDTVYFEQKNIIDTMTIKGAKSL